MRDVTAWREELPAFRTCAGWGVCGCSDESRGWMAGCRVMADAPDHGWRSLYHERYPHAGGAAHYAGWLENAGGFKVELVADR